ncbi:MAG: DUF4127 family protein, partial [Acaryochloridaceae cyanobacterium RL_2_7]|nr:DUF4127 family protein [Acaryochloridaceae cyanobacterium RL_2_7]
DAVLALPDPDPKNKSAFVLGVAIADVAFANGGETELVQLLDDRALWYEVLAYGGGIPIATP